MANQNVRFYFGTQAKYDALIERDSLALYFIEDTQRLYKGNTLLATGTNATSMASGLMSAEDKIKLDTLVAGQGLDLQPVDGSITISDGDNGTKLIGVAISSREGNALTKVDGALFVPSVEKTIVPEYAIEKQEVADAGYTSSYKLKKTVNGEVSYVGDTINVAKDMVLKSAVMRTVAIAGVPYEGAEIGDPYIDMAFNDESASHIYLPVKGLVDTYVAGDGIEIIDNRISIKLAAAANGLVAVDGSLSLNLATRNSAGAMSAEDKLAMDAIPYTYEHVEYEVSHKPTGTLVSYMDKEIRVLCPSTTEFAKQSSGEGADADSYYIGFKAYAPEGTMSFKEDLAETITDDTMYFFDGNDFAGVDEFGRKYSIVWLPVAKYNSDSDSWTYYGDSSTDEKYIGWYYSVNWYDINGLMIHKDTIRISLLNENLTVTNEPYYVMTLGNQLEELQNTVNSMSTSYVWGEL